MAIARTPLLRTVHNLRQTKETRDDRSARRINTRARPLAVPSGSVCTRAGSSGPILATQVPSSTGSVHGPREDVQREERDRRCAYRPCQDPSSLQKTSSRLLKLRFSIDRTIKMIERLDRRGDPRLELSRPHGVNRTESKSEERRDGALVRV